MLEEVSICFSYGNEQVRHSDCCTVVSGSPITDVYPGEISVPNLGMKVEIWDSFGRNIENTGERGDLVITKPFFSMPLGFWGDGGEAKYRAAYFEQFPGVWYHGDLIRKNPVTNGYEILGRSDGVLNPGGKTRLLLS